MRRGVPVTLGVLLGCAAWVLIQIHLTAIYGNHAAVTCLAHDRPALALEALEASEASLIDLLTLRHAARIGEIRRECSGGREEISKKRGGVE